MVPQVILMQSQSHCSEQILPLSSILDFQVAYDMRSLFYAIVIWALICLVFLLWITFEEHSTQQIIVTKLFCELKWTEWLSDKIQDLKN